MSIELRMGDVMLKVCIFTHQSFKKLFRVHEWIERKMKNSREDSKKNSKLEFYYSDEVSR